MLIKELTALKQVTERYETSADWDAKYAELENHLHDTLELISDPDWIEHMKLTDENFSTQVEDKNEELIGCVKAAIDAMKELMDEMESAA